MRRYLEIYWMMMRNSLIREMSFKANFILWMFVELLWFVGQILFLQVLFSYVDTIGGWSKWEVVLLIGTHQVIGQIFQAFFYMNVANLPELVRTGKLDFMLLLPVDSQFAVSTRQFGLDSVVNAGVGIAIVVLSLAKLHVMPGVAQVLLYFAAVGLGVAIHYSIMFFLATMSFWIVRAQGLDLRVFQHLQHCAVSANDLSRVVQDRVQLGDSGDHRGKCAGANPCALIRAARAVDGSTRGGGAYRGGGRAVFLAVGIETILKRKFLTRRRGRGRAKKSGFSPCAEG